MQQSPKRILIFSWEFLPFHGGIATYCAEMAQAAAEAGNQVTVVCPDYHQDNSSEDSKKPYKVHRFPGLHYSTKQLPRIMFEALKINPDDYDIIHAAEWSAVVGMHLIRPLKKLPFIATVHGTDIFGYDTSRVLRTLKATDTLKHAKYIVTNSDFTARLTKDYHPYIDPQKVRPTLLGVNPWWFETAKDTNDLRNRYDIAPDKKIILTVARLDERKGHRTVLKALALLPQEDKNKLVYVIVGKYGSDEYVAELKNLAEACGVRVLFAGGIDIEDVRSFYKTSWLFCMPGEFHPKRIEGFGLAYLEAAAQKLPALATPIGGVPEVVVNGQTGTLINDVTPEKLALEISDLLKNPEKVSAMGEKAYEWAQKFTWSRCVGQAYDD
ncbi:MAG: hypothetical protein DI551_09800 [Micavibrio aeruginosavorus]|uniref:Glycosyltransferase family 1 protein n=1 Tax=Micavibrio aeruginosavorus TaxID=349221 RepID=A0A2W5MUX8_9BACT|nr:MAG: hypothetical protein DI551_09800 [Micavibrio aeruginosavorus]